VVPLSAAGSHDLRVLWDVRRLCRLTSGCGRCLARMAAMSSALTPGKCRWTSGARSIAALGPGNGWVARVTPWSGYRAPRNGGLARAASYVCSASAIWAGPPGRMAPAPAV